MLSAHRHPRETKGSEWGQSARAPRACWCGVRDADRAPLRPPPMRHSPTSLRRLRRPNAPGAVPGGEQLAHDPGVYESRVENEDERNPQKSRNGCPGYPHRSTRLRLNRRTIPRSRPTTSEGRRHSPSRSGICMLAPPQRRALACESDTRHKNYDARGVGRFLAGRTACRRVPRAAVRVRETCVGTPHGSDPGFRRSAAGDLPNSAVDPPISAAHRGCDCRTNVAMSVKTIVISRPGE